MCRKEAALRQMNLKNRLEPRLLREVVNAQRNLSQHTWIVARNRRHTSVIRHEVHQRSTEAKTSLMYRQMVAPYDCQFKRIRVRHTCSTKSKRGSSRSESAPWGRRRTCAKTRGRTSAPPTSWGTPCSQQALKTVQRQANLEKSCINLHAFAYIAS